MPSWTRLTTGAMLIAALAACEPGQEGTVGDTAAGTVATEADTMAARDTMMVQATLTEWSIELAQDTLMAGPVIFHIRNQGTYEHRFEVEDDDDEWATDRIPPGGQTALRVELRPGTYEVYCPIDDEHGDHEELGMETRLVVRERPM